MCMAKSVMQNCVMYCYTCASICLFSHISSSCTLSSGHLCVCVSPLFLPLVLLYAVLLYTHCTGHQKASVLRTLTLSLQVSVFVFAGPPSSFLQETAFRDLCLCLQRPLLSLFSQASVFCFYRPQSLSLQATVGSHCLCMPLSLLVTDFVFTVAGLEQTLRLSVL